jgi:hypothetical protein
MGVSRCCRNTVVLLLALTRAAAAEQHAQAELTTLLESDNLLGGPPAEPPPWEALGSLRAGRDNRARFTLAADEAGYLPGLSSYARLRFELGLDDGGAEQMPTLRDLSSSLGFSWQATRGARLTLSAYPFDSDYVRLGYLHALDWGGTRAARRESVFLGQKAGAPSLLFGLHTARIRLFAGLKWATADDALSGRERLWGALGGGSLALSHALSADAGLGVFQRQRGFVEGASLRLIWHRSAPEPELSAEPFRPPSLRDEPTRLDADAPRGFAVALEGVLLVARQPADVAHDTRGLTTAAGGALYGSARGAVFAGHAALTWRSLAFVLRNDARFSPADELPALSARQAELTAWIGGSFRLSPAELVPSLEVGARLPAALQTESALAGVPQTWMVSERLGLVPLPLGSARLPVLAARLSLRWQVSPSLGVSLAGDYQRNPNRVRLGAEAQRLFDAPDSLSVLGAVQARL